MDAVRALELVGYGERERVRQVLAATLAKTIDDKILFDECFERFFAWHDAAPEQETEPLPPAIDAARPDALHESALSELAALLVAGDAARLQLAIAAAGRAAGLGNMRIFTQRGPVSYTHLRAHETVLDLVCRLLLEQKKMDT